MFRSCLFCVLFSFFMGNMALSETIDLEYMWETDVDADPIFRIIDRVEMSSLGEFWVLDSRSFLIHVFSGDGDLLKSIDYYGDGPGELSKSVDFVLGDEGSVYLLAPFGPKVVDLRAKYEDIVKSIAFLPEMFGEPATGIAIEKMGSNLLVVSWRTFSDQLIFQLISSDLFHGENEFKSVLLDTKKTSRISIVAESDKFYTEMKPWCTTSEGEFFVAASRNCVGSKFIVEHYSSNGKLLGLIEKEIVRHRRNNYEKELAESRILKGPGFVKMMKDQGVSFLVEDFDPDVLKIYEVGSEVWVCTGVDYDSNTLFFDAYSKGRQFRRSVNLVCHGVNLNMDILYLWEEAAIVVKGVSDVKSSSVFDDPREDQDPLQIQGFKFSGGKK